MKYKRFELEMIADDIIDIVKDKTSPLETIKSNLIDELVNEFQIEIPDDDEY